VPLRTKLRRHRPDHYRRLSAQFEAATLARNVTFAGPEMPDWLGHLVWLEEVRPLSFLKSTGAGGNVDGVFLEG